MHEICNDPRGCIYEVICVEHNNTNQDNIGDSFIYEEIVGYLEEKLEFILYQENEEVENIVKKANITNEKEIICKDYTVANKIAKILLSRDFNYQSTKNVQHHIPRINEIITRHVSKYETIPLYLDLGGGYHASTSVDKPSISFDINLGEVLLLYQIKKLYNKIKPFYPPAIKFTIVIDNVVANYVNDIPIDKTLSYCEKFRALISLLNMDSIVYLLVESEHCNWSSNLEKVKYHKKAQFGVKEHLNIIRFLGRDCTFEEAGDRLGRYEAGVRKSDELLNSLIGNEIRFVQRSDDGQLTFRPFPGGAIRIQCGIVGFRMASTRKMIPLLVTTESKLNYRCYQIYLNLIALIYKMKNKNLPASDIHFQKQYKEEIEVLEYSSENII